MMTASETLIVASIQEKREGTGRGGRASVPSKLAEGGRALRIRNVIFVTSDAVFSTIETGRIDTQSYTITATTTTATSFSYRMFEA